VMQAADDEGVTDGASGHVDGLEAVELVATFLGGAAQAKNSSCV
jgi:hypothetical protein